MVGLSKHQSDIQTHTHTIHNELDEWKSCSNFLVNGNKIPIAYRLGHQCIKLYAVSFSIDCCDIFVLFVIYSIFISSFLFSDFTPYFSLSLYGRLYFSLGLPTNSYESYLICVRVSALCACVCVSFFQNTYRYA